MTKCEWEEQLMLIRGALILNGELTKRELVLYVFYGKDEACVKLAAKRYEAGEYTC